MPITAVGSEGMGRNVGGSQCLAGPLVALRMFLGWSVEVGIVLDRGPDG